MKLFRDLNPEEEEQYRQWARDNYKPFSEISGLWHPAVQDECVRINSNNFYHTFKILKIIPETPVDLEEKEKRDEKSST